SGLATGEEIPAIAVSSGIGNIFPASFPLAEKPINNSESPASTVLPAIAMSSRFSASFVTGELSTIVILLTHVCADDFLGKEAAGFFSGSILFPGEISAKLQITMSTGVGFTFC